MRHGDYTLAATVALVWSFFPVSVRADPSHKPSHGPKKSEIIWENPKGRVDLMAGPGGRDGAPKPPFHFVEEDSSGSNPKIKVKDLKGKKWSVKWGEEVHSDTFASRLAWAVGYITEPTYFVGQGKLIGAKDLKRAKNVVKPDGSFSDSRFQLRSQKMEFLKKNNWAWTYNPFIGTKELNGLKIMVMLTSDWDNKDARDIDRDANTAIFKDAHHGQIKYLYFIPDWGGTMGKWGNTVTRSKWDCKGYASQNKEFIQGVKNGFIQWGFSGQHTKDATDGITVNDVKWLLQYLGRITDGQLRAGLSSSGATAPEVECFTPAIRDRITRLQEVVTNPARWERR